MNLFKKREKPSDANHILTNIAVLIYWPIAICIPFLTPDDIMVHSWARSFADYTALHLPLVAEIGKATSTPALYFAAAAINLAAIIFSFITLCSSLTLDKEFYMKGFGELSQKEKMKSLFLYIPVGIIFWWLSFFKYPPVNIMISSMYGMAFFGSLFIGMWFLLGLSILTLIVFYILFRKYLQWPKK